MSQELLGMLMVLAKSIVPSQANVTFPPPAMAARSAASVQLVTTPPAWAPKGKTSKASSAKGARPIRRRKRVGMELVADVVSLFVFILHSFLTLDSCSPGGRSWCH
jgi:hypothetical protein